MDHFLAPHSTESMAYSSVSQDWLDWDISHPSFDESLVGHCASYHAVDRYLSGEDLFIPPRSPSELERVLRRHAYDSIHNAIARSRQTLKTGGYSRTCHLAEQSIRSVLDANDNARRLLAWHRPNNPSHVAMEMSHSVSAIQV
ncbi:uncharacterized protein EDB91DRAFT_1101334 [Suillus paluster]|uniref:uncharacterized protein n=1 Tax=Suillus paluster TaxID=48578 RepID=UPI001B88334E|nr:uncharacterized protein EDB91DRAFT_1101334 [Suillus paluster]KAG1754049.1 hypothetical protein EDB91DRAFT_1101334 [Suillus paluster]